MSAPWGTSSGTCQDAGIALGALWATNGYSLPGTVLKSSFCHQTERFWRFRSSLHPSKTATVSSLSVPPECFANPPWMYRMALGNCEQRNHSLKGFCCAWGQLRAFRNTYGAFSVSSDILTLTGWSSDKSLALFPADRFIQNLLNSVNARIHV